MKNSGLFSSERGLLNIYSIASLIAIMISLALMVLTPGWWSFLHSTILITLSSYYLKTHIHKRPVYLLVTDQEITYFCEVRNEMIHIRAADIAKIHTSFCKLEISTTDNSTHSISLMNIKSYQTRWKIKEFTKTVASHH